MVTAETAVTIPSLVVLLAIVVWVVILMTAQIRVVDAARAGARAAVFGLGLGAAMGARPLAVLFGTPYGWICLLAGATLAAVGVWWVERLSRAVEDRV